MFGMDDSAISAGPSSYHGSPMMSSTLKEFEVKDLMVYVSKAANASRKFQPPVIPRKKTEKRDSIKPMPSSSDLTQRKIKEKSSWYSLSRGTSGADHWRPATCKLFESDEGTTLHVYIDNTILYASMYVHVLNHTEIRPAHRSLFDRKDCLGIHWGPGSISMSPTTPAEPLYIQFPDTDTLNVWIVLLRAYAVPEVYGKGHNTREGGLYRMWRQVELTCIQGRNLGALRALDDAGAVDLDETLDMDVYCALWINGVLCGKTAVRKGVGSPDWHESFTFPDLPPFATLEIQVWREKKLVKPILIGTVTIPLTSVRRGDYIEGHFPVMSANHPTGMVSGELKLRVRVVEEIILPSSTYSTVEKALKAKNTLEWISELDSKLGIKNISGDLVAVSLANNKLVEDIKQLADREVDGSEQSHSTLFRGNTVLTKTMEIFMTTKGAAFLEASIGSVIRRLCSEKVAIETDPSRSGKSTKFTEKNVDLLLQWCQELWKSIYDAREKCPTDMLKLFAHIRTLVETRYNVSKDRYPDLPWQGVSAFVFLRFFTPAILHPHIYGFWPGLLDEPVQRSLTLIAKVMISLANLNTTLQRDDYPRLKEFLTNTSAKMVEYLSFISTEPPETPQSPNMLPASGNGFQRSQYQRGFYIKKASLPLLYRESIPELPHMLDIGKHLATITSVVVRHTRHHLPARIGSPSEHDFDLFCQRCLEVEENALIQVSKMAGRSRTSSSKDGVNSPTSKRPPISPIPITPDRQRRTSSSERRRLIRIEKRPATAPPGDADLLRSQPSVSSMSSSPGGSIANIPRVTSYDLTSSSKHSANSSVAYSLGEMGTEDSHLKPSRPLLVHHPRSASTDSALPRRGRTMEAPSSPTNTAVCLPFAPDLSTDEMGVRKKGLLRGILRR